MSHIDVESGDYNHPKIKPTDHSFCFFSVQNVPNYSNFAHSLGFCVTWQCINHCHQPGYLKSQQFVLETAFSPHRKDCRSTNILKASECYRLITVNRNSKLSIGACCVSQLLPWFGCILRDSWGQASGWRHSCSPDIVFVGSELLGTPWIQIICFTHLHSY